MSDTSAILEELQSYDTCTMSDTLDFMSISGATYGVTPMSRQGVLVGRALTVDVAARGEEGAGTKHLSTEAISEAEPGDIIVMANHGRLDVSCWGDIVTHAAIKRGVRGAIVDGACRDVDASAELGFPVFARAAVPISARGRLVERSNRQPVVFAGVTVNNGDYIIGDSCGVVFIPSERIDEALDLARKIVAREGEMVGAVTTGASVADVMHDDEFESIVK